ncbi:hypothetical protein Hsw_PA0178 (plasmid) [Hymenobacter swuensis DY53]|uniref:Uncharacterized protein n=1 Tax=Hymenobacter swuensis DY53 TaxID=1227739 RepID=W8EYV2_9BACT|nr:hypothetical protein Hsw_PA0178 [Hymenobacter swuensis DY53]
MAKYCPIAAGHTARRTCLLRATAPGQTPLHTRLVLVR